MNKPGSMMIVRKKFFNRIPNSPCVEPSICEICHSSNNYILPRVGKEIVKICASCRRLKNKGEN